MNSTARNHSIRLPAATDIEHLAENAGFSMSQVCRTADISLDTFGKWKAGRSSPSLSTVQKMLDAIEERARDAR